MDINNDLMYISFKIKSLEEILQKIIFKIDTVDSLLQNLSIKVERIDENFKVFKSDFDILQINHIASEIQDELDITLHDVKNKKLT